MRAGTPSPAPCLRGGPSFVSRVPLEERWTVARGGEVWRKGEDEVVFEGEGMDVPEDGVDALAV